MYRDELVSRMWVDALDRLERAERLQRRFFMPAEATSRRACWAPPMDVFESPGAFIVQVALPDVEVELIEYQLNDHVLTVAGERRLSRALAGATIRRMELPQGRFERRIAIAAYRIAETSFENGCLTLVLEK